jgi:ABC-type polysaccharide/polyol phosphate transport system ATPase subunit
MSLPTVSDLSQTQPVLHAQPESDDPVVSFENVSVLYRVPRERVGTLKEYAIRRLQGRIQYQKFLALKDASFQVRQGEIFGLIGANGAGKSTALKLMARVLRPSQGRVRVRGRVAPLLAMGAGFHPELTGRENVYLNATLLGFTRRQIDERFEHIVDFAELWDFIDAPLRTYSSGMITRLGFAVASDQMPDVLILDEVLAVGDTAFQEKCVERIRAFQANGATTLFVSHSMPQVRSMCQRVVWLDHGSVRFIGKAEEGVDMYLEHLRPL